jgi:hypothetical protein
VKVFGVKCGTLKEIARILDWLKKPDKENGRFYLDRISLVCGV